MRLKAPGVSNHRLGVQPPGPVLERIIEIALKRNIHDRREVQVETKEQKNLAGERAVALDQAQIALVAKLPRAGRFRAAFLETRNASALLVDGHNGHMLHLAAQIVDQFAQLGWRLDVAPEKNKAGR